jgi:hypothetical protein
LSLLQKKNAAAPTELALFSFALYSDGMSKQNRVGRPATVAPAGYVSIADAMERTGCSYSVVYRHVRDSLVHWRQEENGTYFVWERDLDKIRKHEPPADRERIPVQLAPDRERHRAWTRVAKARRISVTELGYQLMDKAAGYEHKEE